MRASFFRWPLVLSLLGCLLIGSGPSAAPPPPLADRVDDLLRRWDVDEAFWGIAVYDVEAEEMIYSRNPQQSFLPASNQKLITSATALDVLGSTHRYETVLHYDGTTEGAVMSGDLILEGSGDPTFGSTQVRGEDPLRVWSERLAEMGVERIEGRLIGDDNAFDDRPYPEGWTVNYITDQKGRYMGNSAGGLSYRDNVVPVTVRATSPGASPRVVVQPSGVVSVDNRAETSARWRGSTLRITRTFSTNELVLTGSVARSYDGSVAVPISDPTDFTLQSFVKRLNEAGIETDLQIVDVDALETRPERGAPLFVEYSRPLAEIAAVVNKESNNFYAEQIFRSYGWGGSARGAARRSEAFLQEAGINTQKVLIHDGSGLSRKDLVTPEAMVQLLAHMTDHQEREAFLASLPRGGENNTTLDYRLADTRVQAKTGSLEFVRALSGYTERANGNRVAFALFANNYTGPSYRISRTIDDIVRAVAASTPS
jgi:D-alanyl-D-alanine carboxypeptidase/D-alanyl-D-alanine-endopeptidase (penicillin-binding protein 4)